MDWIEGTPIGEYRLLREIDRGAGGVLYAACRADDGRPVMLAVLSLDRVGESLDGIARAGDLCHPGLARLEGIYRFQDLVFVVSERPEGRPLHACLSGGSPGEGEAGGNGKLDAARAAALFHRIRHALSFAHDRGLVHGDLRPSDILLRDDGSPAVVGVGWIRFLLRAPECTAAEASDTGRETGRTVPPPPGPEGDFRALAEMHDRTAGPGRGNEERSREKSTDRAGGKTAPRGTSIREARAPESRRTPGPPPAPALAGGEAVLDPERKSPRSQRSSVVSGLALAGLVGAVSLFVLVLSLFMTGVLPGTLRALSERVETARLRERLQAAMETEPGPERITALERVLREKTGGAAAVPVHRALARAYLAQDRLEAALGEYLLLLHMVPGAACGEDLLRLARRFEDSGYGEVSDHLLEAVKEHCRGRPSAWEALLLERRLRLDAPALEEAAQDLALLLSGPLRDREPLYGEGRRRLEFARGLSVRSTEMPGKVLVTGDFLPEPGEEVVTLHEGTVAVHGAAASYRIEPREPPEGAWKIPGHGGGEDRLLFALPSGAIEAWDPADRPRSARWTFAAGGTVSCAPLFYRPGTGTLRAVAAVTAFRGGGSYLLDVPCAPGTGEDSAPAAVFTRLEGGPVTALLPAGSREPGGTAGNPSILLFSLVEGGTRITRMVREAIPGRWKAVERCTVPAEIRRACALPGGGDDAPPVFLAGVDLPLRLAPPSSGGEAPGLPPGLYRVEARGGEGAAAAGPEGEEGAPPFHLVAEKILAYRPASRGALFLDVACGDIDGDGRRDAAFLVVYPGEGTRPPERRILVRNGRGTLLWLRCPEARGLTFRKRSGEEGGDTLVVDTGTETPKILAAWRRIH